MDRTHYYINGGFIGALFYIDDAHTVGTYPIYAKHIVVIRICVGGTVGFPANETDLNIVSGWGHIDPYRGRCLDLLFLGPRIEMSSYEVHTRMIRSRILSGTGVKGTDASTWIAVKEGRMGRRIQPTQGPAYDLPGCCPISCSGEALTVSFSDYISVPPGYTVGVLVSWNAIPGASSYTVTVDTSNNYIVEYPSLTTANVYVDWNSQDLYIFTVTANSCDAVGNIELGPCFLAGSLVQMADGSQKAIEDVAIGDIVLGAFGEANPVLALHRPLLGSAHMNRINQEHSTTAHHPHVSVDRGFYCSEPATAENATYGQEHEVIDETGVVKRLLHGLKKGRVQRLDLGIVLKTVEGGRPVTSLETYSLPPETQLYNLVTGGSHTFHVDGYAVTGWPREDDWDYDNWCPRVECHA